MGNSRVIQQVHFADGTDIYICGWDEENNILRYRNNISGTQEISEEIKIDGNRVLLSTCWFQLEYLLKFIEENTDGKE